MRRYIKYLAYTFVIIFALSACNKRPSVETGVSVYNPYPELQNPAIGYFQDAPVERQIEEGNASALLIRVKEVLPSFEKESDPDWFGGEALLEEKGVSDLPGIPYQPYLIEIEQCLAGDEPAGEAKLMIGGALLECSPEMKEGDRFVLLCGQKEDGYYYPCTCSQSFFYVSDENRVYPGSRTDSFLPYTGMTVEMFKDAVSQ